MNKKKRDFNVLSFTYVVEIYLLAIENHRLITRVPVCKLETEACFYSLEIKYGVNFVSARISHALVINTSSSRRTCAKGIGIF